MDELDREPRPLGWLFVKNPTACAECGHVHDCRTIQEER